MAIEINSILTTFKLLIESSGAARTTLRPNEQNLLGSYQVGGASAVNPTGTIASFRWSDPTIRCVVRKIYVRASTFLGFTAAQEQAFGLTIQRSWSAADTGGTAITAASRKRSTMPVSVLPLGNFRLAPVAGTRTPDPNAFQSAFGATGPSQVGVVETIFDKSDQSQYPLVLGANEGFTIDNFIGFGAVGQVRYSFYVEWDEFSAY